MLTFDYKKIYQLPQDKTDYKLDFAIYTTMTLDYTFWKKALALQAGLVSQGLTVSLLNAALERELYHTAFICENDCTAASRTNFIKQNLSKFMKSIYYYKVDDEIPCFHPKLTILRYVSENRNVYYRIAVLSKNLTSNSSDEEIGIILDGSIGQEETENGKRLQMFLDNILNNEYIAGRKEESKYQKIREISYELRNLSLNQKNASIYFGGIEEHSLYKRIFDSELNKNIKINEIHIISKGKFVGSYFRTMSLNHGRQFKIYYKSAEIAKDKTHVKAYLVNREEKSYEFWMGSANCSDYGLGREGKANIECLVKLQLDSRDEYDNILQAYRDFGYIDSKGEFPEICEEENSGYGKILLEFSQKAKFKCSTVQIQQDKKSGGGQQYNRKIELIENEEEQIKIEDNINGSRCYNSCIYRSGYRICWVPLEMYNRRIIDDKKIILGTPDFKSGNDEIPTNILVLMLFDVNDELSADNIRLTRAVFIEDGSDLVQKEEQYSSYNSLADEFLRRNWFEAMVDNPDETKKEADLIYGELMKTADKSRQREKCNLQYSKICRLYGTIKTGTNLLSVRQNPYISPIKGTKDCLNLLGLKEFQKRSVEHIVRQFKDKNTMLLADEAGMGKTKVSLGIIAEMALNNPKSSRFNVFYACSNARIRKKNVHEEIFKKLGKRLPSIITVYEHDCDRLSLLPSPYNKSLKAGNGAIEIHLYSFSTSLFDTDHSKFGTEEERRYMAEKIEEAKRGKNPEHPELLNFSGYVDHLKNNSISEEDFRKIRKKFNEIAISKVSPSLLIMDEFHRFNDKMEDIANLMGQDCKILMLSATPYDMTPKDLTINYKPEEEYEVEELAAFNSFQDLISFLVKDEADRKAIEEAKVEHEKSLRMLSANVSEQYWEMAKCSADRLAGLLRKYICRSERATVLGSSGAQKILPYSDDIFEMNQLCSCILYYKGNKGVQYAKYAPGIRSFALKYYNKEAESKKDIDARKQARYSFFDPKQDVCLGKEFIVNSKGEFIDIDKIGDKNIALAQILEKNVCGAEQLLWVPPSKPYYQYKKDGIFNRNSNYSKLFVFSNLKLIPRAVGSLISGYVDKHNETSSTCNEGTVMEGAAAEQISLDILPEDLCRKLALTFNPKENKWAGMDCAEIVRELCSVGLTENEAWYAVGSPQVCAFRILKNAAEEGRAIDGDILGMAAEIHRAFIYYFNRIGIRQAVNKITEKMPLIQYCADGNLDAVMEEFLFTFDTVEDFVDKIIQVLRYENSRVHLLYEGIDMSKDDPVIKPCHFSERFTQDMSDSNEHNENREKSVQDAFNSPFWPMILTSTSVAQEGLDFHLYCSRIMHYTLPLSPAAFEQRDGRIDRYHSHTLRRRRAYGKRTERWEDLFPHNQPGESGIAPHWNCEAGDSNVYMERYFPVFPLSSEEDLLDKLMACRRIYRSVIGMPNEIKLMEDLTNAAAALGKNIEEIYPRLIP